MHEAAREAPRSICRKNWRHLFHKLHKSHTKRLGEVVKQVTQKIVLLRLIIIFCLWP